MKPFMSVPAAARAIVPSSFSSVPCATMPITVFPGVRSESRRLPAAS